MFIRFIYRYNKDDLNKVYSGLSLIWISGNSKILKRLMDWDKGDGGVFLKNNDMKEIWMIV